MVNVIVCGIAFSANREKYQKDWRRIIKILKLGSGWVDCYYQVWGIQPLHKVEAFSNFELKLKGQKFLFSIIFLITYLLKPLFVGIFVVQVIISPACFIQDFTCLHLIFKASSTKNCGSLNKLSLYSSPGRIAIGMSYKCVFPVEGRGCRKQVITSNACQREPWESGHKIQNLVKLNFNIKKHFSGSEVRGKNKFVIL